MVNLGNNSIINFHIIIINISLLPKYHYYRPSTVHDSLYLYASRLLTPIWYIEVAVLKESYLCNKSFISSVLDPIKSLCSVLESKFSVTLDETFAESSDPRKKEQRYYLLSTYSLQYHYYLS